MIELLADSLAKIAVIGMAGRYPEARNLEQFWANLKDGKECITFFADEELLEAGVSPDLLNRPDFVKAQGVFQGTYLFDAAFFDYTPREAEFLDPQHRVFLECTYEALENAGYDSSRYPGRISLFAGSGFTQYLFDLLSIPGIYKLSDGFALPTYSDKDFLATRVGYKLNFRGPCITVQTACSTSLVAVVLACQNLLSYQSDIALAGGVTLTARERSGYMYQEGGIVSPDGHCRAFDADASGIVGGSGAGVVVLKRLEDAIADGDTIQAVILGVGLTNDGAARIGFAAPGIEGQVAASSDAIAMAGIDPETIGYVECHGTATPLGDPIEITALTKSFRAYTERKNFCAIGSVKTNIGHTDTAAGVAGLTKAVLMLRERMIPASLNFKSPNPELELESSPFYVNTKLVDWKSKNGPRRAAVSSFGLGGTNAHMVLEEAPEQSVSPSNRPWNLLVWSARTESALDAMQANLHHHLEQHPELHISDVAFTLQTGRRVFPHRKALVCKGREGAFSSSSPAKLYSAFRMKEPSPVTFLFPGHGAQYVNMGRELYLHVPFFREQVRQCAEILEHEMDLVELLYPDAEKMGQASAKLEQIKYSTPAMFTIQYALAKLWIEWGVQPESMIGHSTGEFAAACIAGVCSLEDALRLVTARGRLMQQLPCGAMMGVMLSEQELMPLLASFEGISVAVVNLPSTCVVSGHIGSMEKLEVFLREKGVIYRRLHIHHAAHSEMMEPILNDFRHEVQKIKLNAPKIPYLSNLSGTWITPEESTSPDYWVRHLRETVRFSDALSLLLNTPERMFLEVGPGHMLTSLVAQHPARSSGHTTVSSLLHPKNDPQTDLELLLTSLGQMWLQGVRIDWARYYAGETCHRVALPSYPFERQHYQLTTARPRSTDRVAEQHSASAGTRNVQREDTDQKSPAALGGKHPRPNLTVQYVAPRNELEQAIATIWQETLGIDQPGINDNFVALGGHSLLAIQLATRMREIFEIEFSVASLYQTPTIAGLAEGVVRVLTEGMDAETMEEVINSIGGSS